MHRTFCRPRPLVPGALLALLLLATAAPSRAQEQGPPPRPNALIVPVNGTVRLQMATRRPIRQVVNPKEAALGIRTVLGDPSTVLLIGQQPDVTRLDLEDDRGTRESYDVIVQTDVEYLRTQLRRSVPTANFTLIPTANNSVIISGTVTRAEDVGIIQSVASSIGFRAINALRVGGVQQVQLDVVVAQVSRAQFRRMAFDFLTNSKNFFFGSTVGQAVAEPASIGAGGALAPGIGLIGTPGSPNGAPTNLLFGVVHNRFTFLGFLQALRDENLAKLMAEPRLVALSGQPASFLSGGEQAIPVPAGLGQIGVQFEEFGTRLNFIPIVLGNGRIYLEVEPEVSNLDPAAGVSIGGTIVPGRVTHRVHTSVELEAGQTFVIGGLIQRQVLAATQKVPVLGDLPFFGTAFSSKSFQETEEEVVIMVTPYFVDAQSCDQRPRVLPGQETRTPDDFELFLEGIIEAPRGPREVFHGCTYVPAYKNGPSSELYPCAGKSTWGTGEGGAGYGPGCGPNGCGPNGNGGLTPPPGTSPVNPAPADGAAPVGAARGEDPTQPPRRPPPCR